MRPFLPHGLSDESVIKKERRRQEGRLKAVVLSGRLDFPAQRQARPSGMMWEKMNVFLHRGCPTENHHSGRFPAAVSGLRVGSGQVKANRPLPQSVFHSAFSRKARGTGGDL